MKRKKELMLLIGNIGSGKTTYAKKYVEKGYINISKDNLRFNIGAGKYIFDRRYEKTIFEVEKKMFQNFCRLGVNIVVDGTNVTRTLRKRYISYAKRYNYKIIGIVFPFLPRKTALKRRFKDPRGDKNKMKWGEVWEMFNFCYCIPLKKEGFNKLIYLKLEEIGVK